MNQNNQKEKYKKRQWIYLVCYGKAKGVIPDTLHIQGTLVQAFSFPILRKQDLERAEKELAGIFKMPERSLEIFSFTLLPFEGVELGKGPVEYCKYCHCAYKTPQFKCPHCEEYLV